ncbi:MAG: hypothetical protein JXR53_10895 [Bacteroidales bacterium]|nr:hypothetical protein [Bacteroidales bacterium]
MKYITFVLITIVAFACSSESGSKSIAQKEKKNSGRIDWIDTLEIVDYSKIYDPDGLLELFPVIKNGELIETNDQNYSRDYPDDKKLDTLFSFSLLQEIGYPLYSTTRIFPIGRWNIGENKVALIVSSPAFLGFSMTNLLVLNLADSTIKLKSLLANDWGDGGISSVSKSWVTDLDYDNDLDLIIAEQRIELITEYKYKMFDSVKVYENTGNDLEVAYYCSKMMNVRSDISRPGMTYVRNSARSTDTVFFKRNFPLIDFNKEEYKFFEVN